jgi:hypothetical protein
MIDLLWFTAIVSGLNLAGTVALLTMQVLRTSDADPRNPRAARPRVDGTKDVH